MTDLKIFLWAALHHEDFNLCYIKPLIAFRLKRSFWTGYPKTWTYNFEFTVRRHLDIYIPYTVKDAYYTAQGKEFDIYDEIPF